MLISFNLNRPNSAGNTWWRGVFLGVSHTPRQGGGTAALPILGVPYISNLLMLIVYGYQAVDAYWTNGLGRVKLLSASVKRCSA